MTAWNQSVVARHFVCSSIPRCLNSFKHVPGMSGSFVELASVRAVSVKVAVWGAVCLCALGGQGVAVV